MYCMLVRKTSIISMAGQSGVKSLMQNLLGFRSVKICSHSFEKGDSSVNVISADRLYNFFHFCLCTDYQSLLTCGNIFPGVSDIPLRNSTNLNMYY